MCIWTVCDAFMTDVWSFVASCFHCCRLTHNSVRFLQEEDVKRTLKNEILMKVKNYTKADGEPKDKLDAIHREVHMCILLMVKIM